MIFLLLVVITTMTDISTEISTIPVSISATSYYEIRKSITFHVTGSGQPFTFRKIKGDGFLTNTGGALGQTRTFANAVAWVFQTPFADGGYGIAGTIRNMNNNDAFFLCGNTVNASFVNLFLTFAEGNSQPTFDCIVTVEAYY